MNLIGMVEWEEWEWEEQVQAFPVLQELFLKNCKLKCLPSGLASQARALNKLIIYYVQGLKSVENFPSLVELHLDENLDLERITNLPRLQKLTIENCPKLKALEGVPALQRLILKDKDMETLPEYLGGINPRYLELYCSLALLASIAAGQSGTEWEKFNHVEHVKAYAPFNHVEHVKAYAPEGDNEKKWYVLYTANPYNMETNINHSFLSRGILTSFEDTQRFESVFKITRKTFSYICSFVYVPLLEDMNSYTFVDGRVLSLEDRVVVALRRLYSSEPTETLGSSAGVSESTVLFVTESFVTAVCKRAEHHLRWPDSSKMDRIKSMFEKIHNMNNCCGVICTTLIPFGPNWDREKNDSILVQLVLDPEMRFRTIWWGEISSMNQLSILHESYLFKNCQEGSWLNGRKLKVALDGSEVGEYIIGDAGYPLLPWLLTPYQEEDLSESKVEFNRRHSAATTCTLKALARFKDTWKYLQGETSCTVNPDTLVDTIHACCYLHNLVIDMEDDDNMPSAEESDDYEELRQLANEDAVSARDMLSQYFLTNRSSESGVSLVDAEEDREVAASGSGDEDKGKEARIRTSEEDIIN